MTCPRVAYQIYPFTEVFTSLIKPLFNTWWFAFRGKNATGTLRTSRPLFLSSSYS